MSHDLPSARLRIASLLLPLCLSATAFADAPAPKPVLSVPIQVTVAVPPSVFHADGQRHLAYEIQMTNLSASVWTIHRVQVRSESGASLLGAEGKEIGALLRHAARAENDKSGEPGALAPGESVIAYLWIDLANDVSRWCLVAAIAALGMKTSFKALFAVGWRPVGLMIAETLWIAALALFAVKAII